MMSLKKAFETFTFHLKLSHFLFFFCFYLQVVSFLIRFYSSSVFQENFARKINRSTSEDNGKRQKEMTRVYAGDPMKTENRITKERMTLVLPFHAFRYTIFGVCIFAASSISMEMIRITTSIHFLDSTVSFSKQKKASIGRNSRIGQRDKWQTHPSCSCLPIEAQLMLRKIDTIPQEPIHAGYS